MVRQDDNAPVVGAEAELVFGAEHARGDDAGEGLRDEGEGFAVLVEHGGAHRGEGHAAAGGGHVGGAADHLGGGAVAGVDGDEGEGILARRMRTAGDHGRDADVGEGSAEVFDRFDLEAAQGEGLGDAGDGERCRVDPEELAEPGVRYAHDGA